MAIFNSYVSVPEGNIGFDPTPSVFHRPFPFRRLTLDIPRYHVFPVAE